MKPALTAEEWARKTAARDMEGAVGISEVGSIYVDDCSTPVYGPASLRHALAALCLHDQPFGFTHEMVEQLRDIAAPDIGMTQEDVSFWVTLVADRIEALLPPDDALPDATGTP